MHIEEIDSDLEAFFANNEEMKAYCTHIAGEKCIHYKIRNNGNYYRIFCNEPDCPFQITYSQRNSQKFQHGFYLISQSTCLDHKANCANSISSVDDTKNPKYISKQILPLFEDHIPSLCEIKSAIRCFNHNDFSTSELKYIKKLAKMEFFHGATTPISQLVEFCQNLMTKHNWKFEMEFFEGMLTSLILFPPWAEQMLKFYHDPLIVDATFSTENLRFISGVIVDGEWNTQVIGLVIRGTEDTNGYKHLFNFVCKVIGNSHITIIADMAKCIRKAARECFPKFSFVFCYFHLKQNFLKKIKFTPSEDLWISLQQFMKGEMSYELFQRKWIDEESMVDSEVKGFDYLSQIARFFIPDQMMHKRGIISSQRIESLNGKIKKYGNSAYEMLRQFVRIGTKWFEKGASISHPPECILTKYADAILNDIIQAEFRMTSFDECLHFKLNDDECACGFGHDLGIPCPFTIRSLRMKQSESDPINLSLLTEKKLISNDWLTSTYKKAFDQLVERKDQSFQILPINDNEDGFDSTHLDVISSKIRWLY